MSSQTVFVTAGKTSFSHDINLVQNAGASSPGNPITGKAFNTSSLTAYYRIPATGTLTAITLATQTVGGAWSSGGFVEVSSTNDPGGYRFDVPNAVLATAGVSKVVFNGSTDLATHTVYYICQAVDIFTNTYLAAEVTRWNGVALTGKTGLIPEFGIIDSGTAQAATGTTLQLRSAAAFANSELIGATIVIVSATAGAGQSRVITGYTGSTDTATVDTWTTTPTGTIVYIVFAGSPASTSLLPSVNTTQFAGQTVTAAAGVTLPSSVASPTNITAATGVVLSGVTHTGAVIPTVTTTTNLTNAATSGDLTAAMKTSVTTAATAATPTASAVTGNVGGNVAGTVGSVIGAVGSVTGNVGGNVNGSVTSVTTVNDKTGYALSAGGVDAIWDEPKAGHVTAGTYGLYLDAAVSGVSTGGVSVADIADAVWDEAIAAHSNVGSAGALLADTNTDGNAIRSKTDNLTFTKAGEIDANMQSINGTTITGTAPPFNAS